MAVVGESIFSAAGAMSKWDLLWENASQNSNFEAQTIAVDLTEYDCVCVCTRNEKGTGWGWNTSTIVFRERPTELIAITGNKLCYRIAEIVSGGVYFREGLSINTYGSSGTNNGYAIPARIYGIKGLSS